MKKLIKYYVREVYGNRHEYIHPDNKGDAEIVRRLINKKTIDSQTRELIHDLSNGQIEFKQVLAP